ncbi:hypothetical protein AX17_005090 [Amanita inopinata Kibby_2008]|nr:hypothetical protein AX17_005090 [Amanita inopinata Kibby_2008]
MSCCNAPPLWDDDAASLVCTRCGSLLDPSHSLLISQPAHRPPPLATLRTRRPQWRLSGQDKEARHRKNEHVILELLKSLAISLDAPGLAPRAIHIFHQAMSAGSPWGRPARLIAGASLALALSEAKRPPRLQDLASLLNERFPPLSRTFLSLASSLQFKLKISDPSIYISTLQYHLVSFFRDPPQHQIFPASLIETLKPVDFRSAANTAHSLCDSFIKAYKDAGLTAPPTACAAFILATESEIRIPLQQPSILAHFLGAKYHVGKVTVMSRYKLIQDTIIAWIKDVPWLDKYETSGGRAKLSRRAVVARGLKDALRFKEQSCNHSARRGLSPDMSFGDNTSDNTNQLSTPKESSQNHEQIRKGSHHTERRKPTHNRLLQSAATFLLNPHAHLPFPFSNVHTFAPYILSPTTDLISSERTLTRLQLLSRERGGSSIAEISDNELFSEGELEAMFRTDDEVQVMRHLLEFDAENPAQENKPDQSQKRRRKDGGGSLDLEMSRINMSAFAQFMEAGAEGNVEDENAFLGLQLTDLSDLKGYQDDQDVYSDSDMDTERPNFQSSRNLDDAAETVIHGWRPLSPHSQRDVYNWYDEGYDDDG